jgi:hypothetical protein
LVVVLDREVVLAFQIISVAAVKEGVGKARRDANRLVVILERAVVLTFVTVGGATTVKGLSEVLCGYLA